MLLVESFTTQNQQLRLFAKFPLETVVQVNGAPAPRVVVLAPGDFVQWNDKLAFYVLAYHKPQIGPPPASILGKLCPVCKLPFAPDTVCVACACGVHLHCVPAEPGLRCAQWRRNCLVCARPLVLTEGYVNSPPHED